MAEEPNVDGQQPEGGASEPTPAPSKGQGTPVEGDAAQLSELVKQVLAEELKPIKGEISGLYSRQDKDRNQFREFMDEFKKQKASGLSDTEAEQAAESALQAREKQSKRDALMDQLAERFLNEPSTQSPGTGASGAGALAQVIRDNQLDANSPAVAKILADNKGNDVKAALEIGRYAGANASKATGDPSASTSMSTGSGVSEKDVSALTTDYKNEVAAARGNKSLIKGIQGKYKKLGVDIGSVDFRV